MGQEKGSPTEFAGEKCKTGQKRGILEFVGELFINHSFLLRTTKAKERIQWAQSLFYV